MTKRKILLFILLIFALPLYVYSSTYYVDVNGNNGNAGTESSPWKTIQKAGSTVNAGDTVIVKSGTYNERVTFAHSGTSDNKIVFKAAPRRTVYMQGFNTTNAHYIRIEGFDITNNLPGWMGGGIWVSSNNVEIVDNYFHNIPYSAINPNWSGVSTNNIYVANNRIYCCTKGIVVNGDSWLVENNEVERLQHPEGGDCDYSRFFGENHIIRNNYFHGTIESEIGTSHTDGFQTFAVNPGECARNIIIENNIVRDFYHQGFMMEGKEGTHDSIIIRNNILDGAASWGICSEGISNLRVENNNLINMGIHGIGFRMSDTIPTTGIIKNNIFYNAGSNYWSEPGCTLDSGYNLLYKTSGTISASSYPNDLLNIDPNFIDITNDDYHLQNGSPAIDAGDPTFSVPAGGGSRIDIGAYEYTSSDGVALKQEVASAFQLYQNYPNPFNPITIIAYQLLSASYVTLKIFNVLGKEVVTLVDGVQQPGNKSVSFDAKTLASGVYFYRLQSGSFTQTKKLVFLR
jgi:hypothetical protein